jgi:DNA sulfur modification protein DndD
MVVFKNLRINNFKRFAGSHQFTLFGEGQMTVFAAQNGVGKTTLMDSIFLCLYGRRGFQDRYSKITFNEWLQNALSIEAPKSDYPEISFSIEIHCPIRGSIDISRKYWILKEEDGGITEELVVNIDSKPLELEKEEKRNDVSERWIEAFLPYSVMKRFLVDGERLSDLDTRLVNREIVEGIDDLLGIGTLDRLLSHLQKLNNQTLRKMAPDGQKMKIDELMHLSEEYLTELNEMIVEVEEKTKQLEIIDNRMGELNKKIQNFSSAKGDEDNKLRIDWVKKHSELNSVRNSLLEITNSSLPFILAELPLDLEDWNIRKIRTLLEEQKTGEDNISFVNKLLNEIKPSLDKKDNQKIIEKAKQLIQKKKNMEINSPLSTFDLDFVNKIEKRHIELNLNGKKSILSDVTNSASKNLEELIIIEEELRNAADGAGITEIANELKEKAMQLGGLQAEITKLTELQKKKVEGLEQIDEQINAIKSKTDKKSLLNQKIDVIKDLREVINRIISKERQSMAIPLSESFYEGFKLLSRKSDRLEKIEINPFNYETIIKMRGFEGNWLDRDLSATEKQHVGLSLLYALRKIGNKAYPVIIDTPTSRMDKDHKGWSVTRFYPALSHQVIVLATSDDLGNGLYNELKETQSLGCELHIKEKTENSVIVEESNLSNFFGV